MVPCKHCATLNSLDSTFCKKCGTTLPEEQLQEAAAKLEVVIAEGVSLFNAGKFAEAMAVAETAVASNPSSVAALALKGDCHAHQAEIAEAIECYEKIVALNPDSTLDKLRLNQLRNSLVLTAQRAVPDRRLAFVGAAATIVLVVCVAAIIARANGMAEARQASNQIAAAGPTLDPSQPQADFYSQNVGNPPAAADAKPGTPQANAGAQPEAEVPLPRAPQGGLPSVNGGAPEMTITPADPLQGNILPNRTNPPNRETPPTTPPNRVPGGGDEDPTTTTGTKPEPKPEDAGFISIEVRRGGQPVPGGSTSVDSPQGVEALTRTGHQQFLVQNYAGAARSYEQALAGGGDAVVLNQRLGQAYERIGRTGDAVGAYNRAIAAAGQAIASGRGDRDRLSQIQESCRQALKVLQGD